MPSPALTVLGTPIDLASADVPTYVLAGEPTTSCRGTTRTAAPDPRRNLPLRPGEQRSPPGTGQPARSRQPPDVPGRRCRATQPRSVAGRGRRAQRQLVAGLPALAGATLGQRKPRPKTLGSRSTGRSRPGYVRLPKVWRRRPPAQPAPAMVTTCGKGRDAAPHTHGRRKPPPGQFSARRYSLSSAARESALSCPAADRAAGRIRIAGDQRKVHHGIRLEKGVARHMSDLKILRAARADHAGTEHRLRRDLRWR